jgi:hypothetical protein
LHSGSIGWCINGMPISTHMGTIFNGPYSFTQNNHQMGFISTTLIYKISSGIFCQLLFSIICIIYSFHLPDFLVNT